MEATDLSQNKEFMDLYSRQIGAYGIETMGRLVNMKVVLVGLGGVGVETAKNLILAGPGSVVLCDDHPTEMKDIGANFFLTEADIGAGRAVSCAAKLQELNGLVKVSCHHGALDEELVSTADVLVMTGGTREELIRWNSFCRSRVVTSYDARGRKIVMPSPVRFISVGALGALGYIFSDFGDEFTVSDQTGEPPVQRVITGITIAEEGIVSLVNPNDSELAKRADISDDDHEGFISFSEVQGMVSGEGLSLNDSGVWRAREVWNRVPALLKVPKARGGDDIMMSNQYYVHVRDDKTGELKTDPDRPDGLFWDALFVHECKDVEENLFVRDENGNRMQRMNDTKEHYQVKIGDTRGFSPYEGGGILQQVFQPVQHHHKSFAESLQQPIGKNASALLSCDGDKEALGWWYPMLHVLKQGLYQFQSVEGRFPRPNNESEVDQVIDFCKLYNKSMRTLQDFNGKTAALSTVDLDITPRAPPTADGLEGERLQALNDLKAMGTPEGKALLALEASDWSADSAMMLCFDEDSMNKLEAAVSTYKCLEAMRRLARYAATELQPVCVFMGGVCAQEVVKHCGKYTPIDQWLQFDFIEVLPVTPPSDVTPQNCRYDHNISIFGAHIQESLLDVRTFMVGCGALGCELMKNFAMLGVGCGQNGLITVTDGDRIEVSNLNRQFLFRKQHVKKAKSITAAQSVKQMNPNINVEALELLASKETEVVFDEDFWTGSGVANRSGTSGARGGSGGLNFIVNALDNVKARKYVDSQCVFYQKALFESGTEGTKFNTQIVVPGQTVSYDEGEPDAIEGEAIPMCTLRNFPSTIIHCIEWARGLFEDLYVTPIADLDDYLKDPVGFVTELKENAEAYMMDMNEIQKAMEKLCDDEGNGLLRSVRAARAVKDRGYTACVEIAFDLFTRKFNHNMKDLHHQFPKDHMVNGKPFWSPPKRFPVVIDPDLDDEYVSTFLLAVTNLVAVAYGLNPLPVNGIDAQGNDFDTFVALDSSWRDMEVLKTSLPSAMEEWTPSSVKIESDEKEDNSEEKASSTSMQDMIDTFVGQLDELAAISTEGLVAQPADFEKDLDLNFHIDFIAATSNLRASNYCIPRATRHKTKMIAGKIIAAIATSTACATALVGIEMLKYVQQKSVDQYRDSSCNFAVNQFQMSEPTAATVVKGGGERREQPDPVRNPELFDEMGNVKWDQVQCTTWKAYPDPHTKWDSLHLSGSDTLEETIAKLKSDHNLALSAWLITLQDENGKTNGKQIYVEPAVDTTIDEELLVQVAPLNLTQQKATMAIMRCKEMGNKQGYSQRWGLLKMTHGKEYLAKMKTPMRTLLESFTGPLGQVSKVKLEFQLEISSARGVEAVTPAVYLDF
mmetsp:Transcript_34128/g.63687  ORF Transcript_34128/g.63687 Transcript_34128/m.63687 type:complete len:1360 (+) Transcript_34128:153-4232(+)